MSAPFIDALLQTWPLGPLEAHPRQELEAWARAALDDIGAQRPALPLDPAWLGAYVGERVADGATLDDVIALDLDALFLCQACLDGARAAIDAFSAELWPTVRQTLAKLRIQRPLADELEQELRMRLLVGSERAAPGLSGYRGRGRLKQWLRVYTARSARHALQRERRLVPTDDAALAQMAAGGEADHAVELVKRRSREALRVAFRRALAALDDRQKNLLRQRFIDELTLDDLSRVYNVHLTTVHRWVKRAQAALLEAIREQVMRELQLSATECDSLIRFARSRFGATLSGAWV